MAEQENVIVQTFTSYVEAFHTTQLVCVKADFFSNLPRLAGRSPKIRAASSPNSRSSLRNPGQGFF